MKNIADIPSKTKWTALASLESFGIKVPDTLFEEWAEWSIDSIGRNDVEIRIAAKVRDKGEVVLPCEINTIEAVTLDADIFETWKGSKVDENGKTSQKFRSEADYSPVSNNPRTLYIDFEIINPHTIKVAPNFIGSFIYVKASTLLTNGEGELLFTDKQIKAIMESIIAFKARRDYLTGNATIDFEKAMVRAERAIASSRVPTYLSDNEIDRILNVKVSFDRKRYNKDYKIND